jgi:hypothetical protein
MPSDAPTVFISYSHADEPWKDRLVEHLQVLALEDVLDVWDDRRIDAGDDWRPAIEDAMERARVALFLVSTKFLTSKFIRESEVPRILERRKKGLRVIPVIVHPCAWRKVPWLASIQGRPRDGQALALMTDALAEAALSDLAEEIADLVDEKKTKTDRRDGTTQTEPRVSISRLPVTGVDFVGRDDELARWRRPSRPAKRASSGAAMPSCGWSTGRRWAMPCTRRAGGRRARRPSARPSRCRRRCSRSIRVSTRFRAIGTAICCWRWRSRRTGRAWIS